MAEEKILVVDDDEDIREIITMYLESEGYQVITAVDGTEALKYALANEPDLIILDMMMPKLDGIEVCQELRKNLSTPIIFLSCKSTPKDKSIGLIAGGDDYMSKPFDSMELLARVKAHLRRNRLLSNSNTHDIKQNLISHANLCIDLNSRCVKVNDKRIELSPKEFDLLVLLAKNPDKVFTNEEIYQKIWKMKSFGDYSSLMVHISNLRRKIEESPKQPEFIQTVRGVGYKFSNL